VSPTPRRAALTLIELLVATMLIAMVLTAATTAFMQMRAMTVRIQARQGLHDTARIIYERMRWEVSSLMQGSAFFVTSAAATPASPGAVELVFLRGKLDHLDFMIEGNYGGFANAVTDTVWSRWAWDPARRQITLASNNQARSFTADVDFKAGTYNYKGRPFRNLPAAERQARAGSAAATLDANAYGTGATDDIGDYQELLRNAVPIAVDCADFRVEVVCQDGSTVSAPGAADAVFAADGQYVDGRGGSALAKRPRLIRIRFTLTARKTTVSETFSFSFQAPALSPRS
jgi:hypothetical protein